MNMNEYQEFVRSNASPEYDTELAIIGLVGEIGELADAIKKERIYPDWEGENKIIDESGDVLWQFINLLNQRGLNINDVVDYNVKKLQNRHGGKGTASNGGKR